MVCESDLAASVVARPRSPACFNDGATREPSRRSRGHRERAAQLKFHGCRQPTSSRSGSDAHQQRAGASISSRAARAGTRGLSGSTGATRCALRPGPRWKTKVRKSAQPQRQPQRGVSTTADAAITAVQHLNAVLLDVRRVVPCLHAPRWERSNAPGAVLLLRGEERLPRVGHGSPRLRERRAICVTGHEAGRCLLARCRVGVRCAARADPHSLQRRELSRSNPKSEARSGGGRRCRHGGMRGFFNFASFLHLSTTTALRARQFDVFEDER